MAYDENHSWRLYFLELSSYQKCQRQWRHCLMIGGFKTPSQIYRHHTLRHSQGCNMRPLFTDKLLHTVQGMLKKQSFCSTLFSLSISRKAPLLKDFNTLSLLVSDWPAARSFSSTSFWWVLTALNSCTTPLKMQIHLFQTYSNDCCMKKQSYLMVPQNLSKRNHASAAFLLISSPKHSNFF